MPVPQVHPSVTLETPSGNIPLKYSIETISEHPDTQVSQTIARMCQYVCADYATPIIRQDAQTAISLDPSNPLGCIHHFVRSRLRFKRDETVTEPYQWLLRKPGTGAGQDYFVECLIRPVDVSYQFAATQQPVEGDCDDFSQYCAALLMALGIPCSFATVGADASDPTSFSHVYTVAYWRGQRVPMDCSHGPYAGWEAPNKYGKFQEWNIEDRGTWAGLGVVIMLGGLFMWRHRKEIREMFA